MPGEIGLGAVFDDLRLRGKGIGGSGECGGRGPCQEVRGYDMEPRDRGE